LHGFERTRLWGDSLAERADDEYSRERERLREALLGLRDNAELCAQTIRQQLPELTVHDVTHADALWGIADQIAGPKVTLNPVEAFVLGAAFYTHDLALGLAAFPEGGDALRESSDVRDALMIRLFRDLGRWPTTDELEAADDRSRRAALFDVLRRQHAERAEALLKLSLPHPDRESALYLLDNRDLRERYAGLIGTIALSHGWEVDELRHRLAEDRGGPGWAPQWGVDRILAACLLRLADAANVDERRAPVLLQALTRDLPENSQRHWTFQRRLQPAQRKGDRLVFSSAEGFSPADAPAWWLCYETLRLVDRELHQVDAMLSDLKRQRLAARAVAGVDAPARLTAYVAADGWEPVDAQVHVLDVARLVRQLGGEELYGTDASIPLRELIQNGADAVRARRICEKRDHAYGNITVRVGEDEAGPWIEVEDDGLGMSLEVMQQYLLSFGSSYWSSPAMSFDLPELTRKRFVATGRYGIGFFSVFMWGDRVRVSTCRFDMGQSDTRVMEFDAGLGQRPIIRPARGAERLRDGGTRVRVWLTPDKLTALVGLVRRPSSEDAGTLTVERLVSVCSWLAPALDVSIDVEAGGERAHAVTGRDWLTLPPAQLYARLGESPDASPRPSLEPEVLEEDDGQIVGRAALSLNWIRASGIAVVGGLRTVYARHVEGVLLASPIRAARDIAMPLASATAVSRWADKQAKQALALDLPDAALLELAAAVRTLGGTVRGLPVATSKNGSVTFEEIVKLVRRRSVVRLVHDVEISNEVRREEKFVFADDVLAAGMTSVTMVQYKHGGRLVHWPGDLVEPIATVDSLYRKTSLAGAVLEAACEAWGVAVKDVVLSQRFGPVGTRDSAPMSAGILCIMRPGSRQAVDHERSVSALALIHERKSAPAAELARELSITPAVLARLLRPYVEGGRIQKLKGGYSTTS
jgi:Histidine kinase-, DNA gyrase B-, and HSP90-like ATPase